MKTTRFPKVIKRGAVKVRIYRIKHPRTKAGVIYSVAYHDGQARRQKQFTRLKEAEEEARLKADQLAAGRVDLSGYTREDLEELQKAREMAGGVPLLSALAEWQKATEQTQGHLLDAARVWSERNQPSFQRISLAEAYDVFLKAKRTQGVNTRINYERRLPGLVEALGSLPLDVISSRRLQAYLDGIGHPVTRNSVRQNAVTLWRWARRAGYLPRDSQTEAERTDRARENGHEIGVINAETFEALLRYIAAHHAHHVTPLVLAGFCGLRSKEVHGQDWRDVQLGRKFVRITDAKKGTPARRIVPLPDCALPWLAPHAQPAGTVCRGDNRAIDRIRDIGRTNGFKLPPNCFRHSYISHRVAATGDIERTALESGNSPAVIHKHYREVFSEAEGRSWFEIRPEGAQEVKEVAHGA